jgi:hypothetical protein
MGLLNFFRKQTDQEKLHETLRLVERIYVREKRNQPDKEPLDLNLLIIHHYTKQTSPNKINELPVIRNMLKISYYCACLPEPYNIQALGYHVFEITQKDIWNQNPSFTTQCARLLDPVRINAENGTIDNIFALYNPTLAKTYKFEDLSKEDGVISAEETLVMYFATLTAIAQHISHNGFTSILLPNTAICYSHTISESGKRNCFIINSANGKDLVSQGDIKFVFYINEYPKYKLLIDTANNLNVSSLPVVMEELAKWSTHKLFVDGGTRQRKSQS